MEEKRVNTVHDIIIPDCLAANSHGNLVAATELTIAVGLHPKAVGYQQWQEQQGAEHASMPKKASKQARQEATSCISHLNGIEKVW